MCSTGCTEPCGCCPCAEGEHYGQSDASPYVCKGGCYALEPTCPSEDAGNDAAVVSSADACAAGDFYYVDFECSIALPDGGVTNCREVGDHRCYKRCDTDANCQDPCHPFCAQIGLSNHSDYGCEATVKICLASPLHQCAFPPHL
jgi:hypothetical protein